MTTTADPTAREAGEPKKEPFRHYVGPTIHRLERERWKEPTDRRTAAAIGISYSTYSELKSNTQPATLGHLVLLCRYFRVPLDTFFPADASPFVHDRDGLRWQVRAGLPRSELATVRDVTEWVLDGLPPADIATRIAERERAAMRHGAPAIAAMARAGLEHELIELVLQPGATEIQDVPLAERLAPALSAHARPPRPITVRVVRNFAHPDFPRDPIVPFHIARVAHMLVAAFLAEHPHAGTLGIAGGIHLGTFVRTIGPRSSPLPLADTRRFDLVPLTLEPFNDHRFGLADALVGELHSRAAALVGAPFVHALSFKPFGFLEDLAIGPLESRSVLVIRELYHQLDVAIYGCGDRSDDGWIEWTQRMLGLRFDPMPPTDVCLNLISETAEPVPLPEHAGHRREYLGVGIPHLRRLAVRPDKVGMLLASGASKGLPIALVVRAGLANHVVCDQAAALKVLDVLE